MAGYLLRRLLLIIPTLFGVLLLNFFIIQAAPGGPVEQMIAKVRGTGVSATDRFAGEGADMSPVFKKSIDNVGDQKYRGARGLDPEFM